MSDLTDLQVEDHVHYGIGGEERLIAVKPKITPDSSPEPVSKPVSPPTPKGDNAKRRRKPKASLGDSYLLRTAYPNAIEVHQNAERYLPNPESGDEDMEEVEDVADMDDRIAAEIEKAKAKEEQGNEREQSDTDRIQERTQIELAAKALSLSSPAQQPTPSDQMDLDQDAQPEPITLENIPQRRPQLSGLLIDNVPSEPQPLPMSSLMTPLEPRFSDYDNGFLNSPFTIKRLSIDSTSPKEQLPALQRQSPTSPEGIALPQQQLPSAKSLLELADKTNRQRQASISMAAPTNGYRSSFSAPSPSPQDPMSPKSNAMLARSPPSACFPRQDDFQPLVVVKTNESYSTADGTSPVTLPTPQSDHRQSVDETTNPRMLPLPHPDMQRPSPGSIATVPATGGSFKCEFLGCTAPPFQTSYLLNSHANVHSSNRPHYCPVPTCPRAEGGKGFKRKNEMIRHGLVHDSPGYVCPFCPDREHKYPRPDNLQRHVRVHHTDKNKDDPALRDVLAQRPEQGVTRGRRRRLIS